MNLPTHLSYSQINSYLACPLRYRFNYIDQLEPEFCPASLAFGSAIHQAVAAFYQSCLEGNPISSTEMTDVYQGGWESRAEQVRFFNGDDADSLQVKARQMLQVLTDAYDPTVQILALEEFFDIELGDGIPPLRGYIDLIEQSATGQTIIADLKTAARKPSSYDVHNNLQLTAYSVGATSLGLDPDATILRLDVLLKTKQPELIRYDTIRTDKTRRRFVNLVRHVWNGIQREVWFPRQDWYCQQCQYGTYCQNW